MRLEHATLEEFFVQVTASQALGRNSEPDLPSDSGSKGRESTSAERNEAVTAKGGAA
jgi:hypothetical protein